MAEQRLRNSGWENEQGYVDLVYDDVTLDITQIIYANPGPRARIIDVYRMPQDSRIFTRTIPAGTQETAMDATSLRVSFVADAEGSLSLDRWRVQTHY